MSAHAARTLASPRPGGMGGGSRWRAGTIPLAHEQPPALTAREREVAAMVGRGLSNRQIGSELHLSERTIEKHVSKILRMLELSSRTEIAAWATHQRLIAPHPA